MSGESHAPEAGPEPAAAIPWEREHGNGVVRFLATQRALFLPTSILESFGGGTHRPALLYAAVAAMLAGVLRIVEWTHTLHFSSIRMTIAARLAGREPRFPLLDVTPGAGAADVIADVIRAWMLGTLAQAAATFVITASFASLALAFAGGGGEDARPLLPVEAEVARLAVVRAGLYLSTVLVLPLLVSLVLVLGFGDVDEQGQAFPDPLVLLVVQVPALVVLLRGMRLTSARFCRVSVGGSLAVTLVPLAVLFATQTVLVERVLAPLLPHEEVVAPPEPRAAGTWGPGGSASDRTGSDASAADGAPSGADAGATTRAEASTVRDDGAGADAAAP